MTLSGCSKATDAISGTYGTTRRPHPEQVMRLAHQAIIHLTDMLDD